MVDTYTWDKEFNIFSNVSVKDLVENKSGNVSEINILLHNLMQANGIDVKPILLSTRNNGFATRIFPVLSDFNYLIIQVTIDDKKYMLDATDDYLSFGQLPFRCLNQYGRLLDFKEGGSWVAIDADKSSYKKYRVSLEIDENEHITGNIRSNTTGYHALAVKQSYFENHESHLNKYVNTYPSTEFLNYKAINPQKNEPDFTETFEIKQPTELIGDKIYINPFILTSFDKNPLKLQERNYPIDFGYKDAYLFSVELKTENYDVISIPKTISLSLPNNKGTLVYNTNINKDTVTLFFKYSFKEAIYDSAYYESLKEFFSTIVNIQKNSLIVLKKKQ
nr:hypothetical protein [uncultured Psychroserpens sp.]